MRLIKNKRQHKAKDRILILAIFILLLGNIYFYPKVIDLFKNYFSKQVINPLSSPKYFNLERLLNQTGFLIYNINEKNNYYEIFFKDGVKAYLPKDNLEKQAASLQLILKRFKIEGRKVSLIDLRYNKPIVK